MLFVIVIILTSSSIFAINFDGINQDVFSLLEESPHQSSSSTSAVVHVDVISNSRINFLNISRYFADRSSAASLPLATAATAATTTNASSSNNETTTAPSEDKKYVYTSPVIDSPQDDVAPIRRRKLRVVNSVVSFVLFANLATDGFEIEIINCQLGSVNVVLSAKSAHFPIVAKDFRLRVHGCVFTQDIFQLSQKFVAEKYEMIRSWDNVATTQVLVYCDSELTKSIFFSGPETLFEVTNNTFLEAEWTPIYFAQLTIDRTQDDIAAGRPMHILGGLIDASNNTMQIYIGRNMSRHWAEGYAGIRVDRTALCGVNIWIHSLGTATTTTTTTTTTAAGDDDDYENQERQRGMLMSINFVRASDNIVSFLLHSPGTDLHPMTGWVDVFGVFFQIGHVSSTRLFEASRNRVHLHIDQQSFPGFKPVSYQGVRFCDADQFPSTRPRPAIRNVSQVQMCDNVFSIFPQYSGGGALEEKDKGWEPVHRVALLYFGMRGHIGWFNFGVVNISGNHITKNQTLVSVYRQLIGVEVTGCAVGSVLKDFGSIIVQHNKMPRSNKITVRGRVVFFRVHHFENVGLIDVSYNEGWFDWGTNPADQATSFSGSDELGVVMLAEAPCYHWEPASVDQFYFGWANITDLRLVGNRGAIATDDLAEGMTIDVPMLLTVKNLYVHENEINVTMKDTYELRPMMKLFADAANFSRNWNAIGINFLMSQANFENIDIRRNRIIVDADVGTIAGLAFHVDEPVANIKNWTIADNNIKILNTRTFTLAQSAAGISRVSLVNDTNISLLHIFGNHIEIHVAAGQACYSNPCVCIQWTFARTTVDVGAVIIENNTFLAHGSGTSSSGIGAIDIALIAFDMTTSLFDTAEVTYFPSPTVRAKLKGTIERMGTWRIEGNTIDVKAGMMAFGFRTNIAGWLGPSPTERAEYYFSSSNNNNNKDELVVGDFIFRRNSLAIETFLFSSTNAAIVFSGSHVYMPTNDGFIIKVYNDNCNVTFRRVEISDCEFVLTGGVPSVVSANGLVVMSASSSSSSTSSGIHFLNTNVTINITTAEVNSTFWARLVEETGAGYAAGLISIADTSLAQNFKSSCSIPGNITVTGCGVVIVAMHEAVALLRLPNKDLNFDFDLATLRQEQIISLPSQQQQQQQQQNDQQERARIIAEWRQKFGASTLRVEDSFFTIRAFSKLRDAAAAGRLAKSTFLPVDGVSGSRQQYCFLVLFDSFSETSSSSSSSPQMIQLVLFNGVVVDFATEQFASVAMFSLAPNAESAGAASSGSNNNNPKKKFVPTLPNPCLVIVNSNFTMSPAHNTKLMPRFADLGGVSDASSAAFSLQVDKIKEVVASWSVVVDTRRLMNMYDSSSSSSSYYQQHASQQEEENNPTFSEKKEYVAYISKLALLLKQSSFVCDYSNLIISRVEDFTSPLGAASSLLAAWPLVRFATLLPSITSVDDLPDASLSSSSSSVLVIQMHRTNLDFAGTTRTKMGGRVVVAECCATGFIQAPFSGPSFASDQLRRLRFQVEVQSRCCAINDTFMRRRDFFFARLDGPYYNVTNCVDTKTVTHTHSVSQVPTCSPYEIEPALHVQDSTATTTSRSSRSSTSQQQQHTTDQNNVLPLLKVRGRRLRFLLFLIVGSDQDPSVVYAPSPFRQVPPTSKPLGQPQRNAYTVFRNNVSALELSWRQRVFSARRQRVAERKMSQHHFDSLKKEEERVFVSAKTLDPAVGRLVTGKVMADRGMRVEIDIAPHLNRHEDYTVRFAVSSRILACEPAAENNENHHGDGGDQNVFVLPATSSIDGDDGGDPSRKYAAWPVVTLLLRSRFYIVPPAMQVVAADAGFASAIAGGVVSMNPLAATTLNRVNALKKMTECDFSDYDELDAMSSPFRLGWGPVRGQYQRGAVVMNIFICLLLFGVMAFGAWLGMRRHNGKVDKIRREQEEQKQQQEEKSGNNNKNENKNKKKSGVVFTRKLSFRESLYRYAKLPSVVFLAVMFLMQGTVSSSVALLRQVSNAKHNLVEESNVVTTTTATSGNNDVMMMMPGASSSQHQRLEWMSSSEALFQFSYPEVNMFSPGSSLSSSSSSSSSKSTSVFSAREGAPGAAARDIIVALVGLCFMCGFVIWILVEVFWRKPKTTLRYTDFDEERRTRLALIEEQERQRKLHPLQQQSSNNKNNKTAGNKKNKNGNHGQNSEEVEEVEEASLVKGKKTFAFVAKQLFPNCTECCSLGRKQQLSHDDNESGAMAGRNHHEKKDHDDNDDNNATTVMLRQRQQRDITSRVHALRTTTLYRLVNLLFTDYGDWTADPVAEWEEQQEADFYSQQQRQRQKRAAPKRATTTKNVEVEQKQQQQNNDKTQGEDEKYPQDALSSNNLDELQRRYIYHRTLFAMECCNDRGLGILLVDFLVVLITAVCSGLIPDSAGGADTACSWASAISSVVNVVPFTYIVAVHPYRRRTLSLFSLMSNGVLVLLSIIVGFSKVMAIDTIPAVAELIQFCVQWMFLLNLITDFTDTFHVHKVSIFTGVWVRVWHYALHDPPWRNKNKKSGGDDTAEEDDETRRRLAAALREESRRDYDDEYEEMMQVDDEQLLRGRNNNNYSSNRRRRVPKCWGISDNLGV